MGPLGLKKAEQELIKRRYKYSYNNNDSISRVALVYGQPHASGSVGSRNNHVSNLDGNEQANMYQYAPSVGSQRGVGSSVNGVSRESTFKSVYLVMFLTRRRPIEDRPLTCSTITRTIRTPGTSRTCIGGRRTQIMRSGCPSCPEFKISAKVALAASQARVYHLSKAVISSFPDATFKIRKCTVGKAHLPAIEIMAK